MGRKSRHTARTGDGGAELRHKKRQVKEAERAQKAAELEFYDDPSEDDESEEAGSEGSEFGDEEEVMQLGGSGESDSEAAEGSDSVDGDEDADMDEFGDEETKKRISKMDSKWGKSKKTYYSADTAEFELDGDDEAARDEENAALELQRKQATMMDDEDFGFEDNDSIDDDQESVDDEEDSRPVDDEELLDDQLADLSMLADESDKTAIEQVRKDFSKLSKKDKLQIVNQTAPELLGLNAELENTVKELNEIITPAILKLKEVRKKTKDFNTGIQYLVTRQNLMLNYIANISFYLLLRAEGKTVTDHPVLQHLLALKKQMERMRSVDDGVNMQLHNLLTQDFPEDILDDGLDKFINRKSASTKRVNESTNKRLKPNDRVVSREEKEEAEKFYEATLKEREAFRKAKERLYTHEKPGLSSSEDEIDSEVDEGTKRGASYEIIKNKGLKAHKSKINRNPRVKKRLQYRKAVIRRKGQVRDVRVGESGRYGGETTGIKSNLTRSRKIRS